MDKVKQRIEALNGRLAALLEAFDPEGLRKEIREMTAVTMKEGFWDDSQKAQGIMQELAELQKQLETIESLQQDVNDAWTICDILSHDDELDEDESDLAKEVRRLEKLMDQIETKTFLKGRYDRRSAIVSIHAGQGGTEANDWTKMLTRMYMKFGQRMEWKVELLDFSKGDEAGYNDATLLLLGPFAYGYMKHEAGTHRLVRQSPFNADSLRQTTFALVEVLPELAEDDSEVEISDDEIEFEAFRSSGAGGQNVNKVSSAVRIKHLPTGIVVTCQTQRTQVQNRNTTMSMLQAKLWEKKMQKQKEQKSALKGEYQAASWGTQIRSYVLHPYKQVKDLRTGVESKQPEKVLDGELEAFVEAELRLL